MKIAGQREKLDVLGSDLAESRFLDVDLSAATFDDINMTRVAISRANLAGARFVDVDMTRATIENANLDSLSIRGCNVAGMSIDGVTVDALFTAYRAAAEG